MAQTSAIDVSQWQGNINFAGVPQDIVIIKMSGGDAGLYYDSKASQNYYGAKAAGKAVAGYHFAGGTDPIAEAQEFLRAMSPLDNDDVMVLDWEIQHPDPVGWCKAFTDYIHQQAGIWCLVYLNISTTNAYDWSPVLNNCGLYIAAPSFGWDDPIPVRYPVVMQQGGYIRDNGISGNIDSDMFFGTIDQFKAYGFHKANTPPTPDPKPAPDPVPVITTQSVSETKPVPFTKVSVNDATLEKGKKVVSVAGVDGVETLTYTVTLTDGKETSRTLVNDTVTTPPINEVTRVGTKPSSVDDNQNARLTAIEKLLKYISDFLSSIFKNFKPKK